MNSEKYIGLDVHQATISVAVMDSRGKVVMESILETNAQVPVALSLCDIPMPSRTTRKSTRPGASDRSMVDTVQPPGLPVSETDRRRRD